MIPPHSPPPQPSPQVFFAPTPPPPQFSLVRSLPDVSEGVQRTVTAIDVNAFSQLDDAERLKLFANSLHYMMDGAVNGLLLASRNIASGVSPEEVTSLRAEIQGLEGEATTLEAALKKEVDDAQTLRDSLEEANKSLEEARAEVKKSADENTQLSEKVQAFEADIKEHGAPAILKRKLDVAEKSLTEAEKNITDKGSLILSLKTSLIEKDNTIEQKEKEIKELQGSLAEMGEDYRKCIEDSLITLQEILHFATYRLRRFIQNRPWLPLTTVHATGVVNRRSLFVEN